VSRPLSKASGFAVPCAGPHSACLSLTHFPQPLVQARLIGCRRLKSLLDGAHLGRTCVAPRRPPGSIPPDPPCLPLARPEREGAAVRRAERGPAVFRDRTRERGYGRERRVDLTPPWALARPTNQPPPPLLGATAVGRATSAMRW
jgi:hypothetical protein